MKGLKKELKIRDLSFDVSYEYVNRLNCSASIKNKKIIIKISKHLRDEEKIKKVCDDFILWATKKLNKIKEFDFVIPDFIKSDSIVTHNKVYEIKRIYWDKPVTQGDFEDFCTISLKIQKGLDKEEENHNVKSVIKRLIGDDQRAYLQEMMNDLNMLHFGYYYNDVKFSLSSQRFGSCSRKRNINIAVDLLFAPKEVLRYVCAHELAHLKQFNHSDKFWELVQSAIPEYKKYEKWLRDKGFLLR